MTINTKVETLENEIAMMHTCQHKNIVQYMGCYTNAQDLWVILFPKLTIKDCNGVYGRRKIDRFIVTITFL